MTTLISATRKKLGPKWKALEDACRAIAKLRNRAAPRLPDRVAEGKMVVDGKDAQNRQPRQLIARASVAEGRHADLAQRLFRAHGDVHRAPRPQGEPIALRTQRRLWL